MKSSVCSASGGTAGDSVSSYLLLLCSQIILDIFIDGHNILTVKMFLPSNVNFKHLYEWNSNCSYPEQRLPSLKKTGFSCHSHDACGSSIQNLNLVLEKWLSG